MPKCRDDRLRKKKRRLAEIRREQRRMHSLIEAINRSPMTSVIEEMNMYPFLVNSNRTFVYKGDNK